MSIYTVVVSASCFVALLAIGFARRSLDHTHRRSTRSDLAVASVLLPVWFLLAVLSRSVWLYGQIGIESLLGVAWLDWVAGGCLLLWSVVVFQRRLPLLLWGAVALYTLLCWVHVGWLLAFLR